MRSKLAAQALPKANMLCMAESPAKCYHPESNIGGIEGQQRSSKYNQCTNQRTNAVSPPQLECANDQDYLVCPITHQAKGRLYGV
eukprot:scaffold12486_cov37-Prasinocladus_malaysianus.AAC.1